VNNLSCTVDAKSGDESKQRVQMDEKCRKCLARLEDAVKQANEFERDVARDLAELTAWAEGAQTIANEVRALQKSTLSSKCWEKENRRAK